MVSSAEPEKLGNSAADMAYRVLARKYRPSTFDELIGQESLVTTLSNALKMGRLAHAFVLTGLRGIGKTTTARIIARGLNCTGEDGQGGPTLSPCGVCSSCTGIAEGRHVDVIEMDAASNTGVDDVREIIDGVGYRPLSARYKIYIIDEVHMLSISAFNALLKVLEEPPENVVFILCTTEAHKVPGTIISRCQRFDFRKMASADIVAKLQEIVKQEKVKVDKEILIAAARHSEGHMRDAESLLGQVVAIGGKEITREEADLVIPRSNLNEVIDLLGLLRDKKAADAIELINKLIESGVNVGVFLKDMVELMRKIMLLKMSPGLAEKIGSEYGESIETGLNHLARDIELNRLLFIINRILSAQQAVKSNYIIQLPLEIAVIEICEISAPSASKAEKNKAAASGAGKKAPVSETGKAVVDIPLSNAEPVKKENIASRWNEVLAKVKKYNHSLSFILRACEPRSITGNRLCLAFKYRFHKDRISNLNIKNLVEKVIHEVFGRRFSIEPIIDEKMEVKNGNGANNAPAAPAEEEKGDKGEKKEEGEGDNEKTGPGGGSMLENVLKTFGGKVVN
jgi:DNA polymerase III subunit gamma/tau